MIFERDVRDKLLCVYALLPKPKKRSVAHLRCKESSTGCFFVPKRAIAHLTLPSSMGKSYDF
ncbi:hypothetical protein [Nostoc sp.]|uniref:hypothetical protein n=1 Tax=Nostoc sp. TaxID=1180 RepID=UPI002FF76E58